MTALLEVSWQIQVPCRFASGKSSEWRESISDLTISRRLVSSLKKICSMNHVQSCSIPAVLFLLFQSLQSFLFILAKLLKCIAGLLEITRSLGIIRILIWMPLQSRLPHKNPGQSTPYIEDGHLTLNRKSLQ